MPPHLHFFLPCICAEFTHRPTAPRSSLNLDRPLHQHQSVQIKVSNCPFSYWYSAARQILWCLLFPAVSWGYNVTLLPTLPPSNPICNSLYIPVWNYSIDWWICRLWLSSWVSADNGSGVMHQLGQKIFGNGEQSCLCYDNIHVRTKPRSWFLMRFKKHFLCSLTLQCILQTWHAGLCFINCYCKNRNSTDRWCNL